LAKISILEEKESKTKFKADKKHQNETRTK